MRYNRTTLKLMLSNFATKFKAETSGTIQVMGAVGVLVCVTAISVAIDSARLHQTSLKLSAMTDNSALAAAKGNNLSDQEREDIFESMMNMNLAQYDFIRDLEFSLDITDTAGELVLGANTLVKSDLFFGIFGDRFKPVAAFSEVKGRKDIVEVSMVLDVSSSMRGRRIDELKSAATFFSDLLIDETNPTRVKIAIVPYGGTVRVPDRLQRMLIPPLTPTLWIGEQWNNCFKIYPKHLSRGILPAARLESIPSFFMWNATNRYCPGPGNEILGLTGDLPRITDKIRSLTLSDGTGTDVGTAWGFATLDPAWRQKLPNVASLSPRRFSGRAKKFMIVMTDGAITAQYHPLSQEMQGLPPYETLNTVNKVRDGQLGFKRMCKLAKSKGIEVFTIGFEMRDSDDIEVLKKCASNTGNHFETDLGGLQNVFVNIANSLTPMRISR